MGVSRTVIADAHRGRIGVGEQVVRHVPHLLFQQCHDGLYENGSLDRQREKQAGTAEMLSEEDEHGLVKRVDVAVTALVGRFALIVDDGRRDIPVAVSCLEKAVGEVDVFAIHEELFVESPRRLQCLVAAEHERSADNLNLCGMVLVEIAHIVLSQSAAFREQAAQSGHFAKCHPRRGKSAP